MPLTHRDRSQRRLGAALRPRGVALLAVLLAAGCALEEQPAEVQATCIGDAECQALDSWNWTADWTLLVYAANDDRSSKLVTAFDADADEWQHGLGGSAKFRILVERDYARFQTGADGEPRPSERYVLYREEKHHPNATDAGNPGQVELLGETDSSSAERFQQFLIDGIRRFPARHYWVIVTGHGDDWNGLAYDSTTGQGARMPLSGLAGALDAASEVIATEIRTMPGLDGKKLSRRIDVVQFDACRMGSVETASALADGADYLVASQEKVPDAGHPYSALRFIAQDHTGYGPAKVVRAVVTDYVRSYVEGVSTQDRAYVGTDVTSIGLNLRKFDRLTEALGKLREAVTDERPNGFRCSEVHELAGYALASHRVSRAGTDDQASQEPGTGGGRASAASRASIDLIALLESLADAERGGAPNVSDDVRARARAALELIGRPALGEGERGGAQVRYGGQYRKLVSFNRKGPFVVEAQRFEPDSKARRSGLSVFWGDPFPLLATEDGVAPLDTYQSLPLDQEQRWSDIFGACIETARACRQWRFGDPGPNPCDDL